MVLTNWIEYQNTQVNIFVPISTFPSVSKKLSAFSEKNNNNKENKYLIWMFSVIQ